MKGKLSSTLFAIILATPVIAADYFDPVEGILDPLLNTGSGWAVQPGADGLGASVSVLDKSPLNGSQMSIRQVGGVVTPITQRIWKNFKTGANQVTINTGAYIWEWDFKPIRNGSSVSYILRNRLEGVNNNFNEQIATIGLVINPNDGAGTAFAGVHPMLANYTGGGSMEYQFFATELDPSHWYRCISFLDFDSGKHTGPIIKDITGGATDNYVMLGNATGNFNPNPAGGFFGNAQCSTFGAGSGCPVNEGWNVDNQRLTQAIRVIGTATLEGISRPLDFNEEGVLIRFVGTDGTMASSPLSPTFQAGQGTFKVLTKPGTYDIYAFAANRLSKRIATNVTINQDYTIAPFTLLSGDLDEDDVISVFDYIQLSDAFDSSAWGGPGGGPTSNWNPNADFDRDGVVSVFDYIILSNNFDKLGDYPN